MFQKESVIVAVIDSGLTKTKDFEFDQSNLAYNSSESEGLVGVDDDGNGFVDDFLGWNFYDGNNAFRILLVTVLKLQVLLQLMRIIMASKACFRC